MSMFICWDVIEYHIIQFVYHSDIFQMLYRVPNKDFHLMVIAELRRRHRGDILIRDTEHNLIQYLSFAQRTDIQRKKLSYVLFLNDGLYQNLSDFNSDENVKIVSNYYHIRPLILYSWIPEISTYLQDGKLTKIIVVFYKTIDLKYSGHIVDDGFNSNDVYDGTHDYPVFFGDGDIFPIKTKRQNHTGEEHVGYTQYDYHEEDQDAHYCAFNNKLMFEFHGLNSIETKIQYLSYRRDVHKFHTSDQRQGFKTVIARIKKILRTRAVVFGPNYYVHSVGDNHFDRYFKFPGRLPRLFSKLIEEIYFGNVDKLLEQKVFRPTYVYECQ